MYILMSANTKPKVTPSYLEGADLRYLIACLRSLFCDDRTDTHYLIACLRNILHEDSSSIEFSLENILATLKPASRSILRSRYGLDDGKRKTLEEIGVTVGVTRERIRQIEK